MAFLRTPEKTNKNTLMDQKNLIPIYSPRSQYSKILEKESKILKSITLAFDPFTIQSLKMEFSMFKEVNKSQFIFIMMNNLSQWRPGLPNRKQILVRCLGKFFDQVDINCNQICEWEEFANHIVNKIQVQNQESYQKESENTYKPDQSRFQA